MVGLEPDVDVGAMTTLKVHEVRFFDPKPKAIQGLAFEAESNRLAVVRCSVNEEEGRPAAYFLEIWNLSDTPCLEFKVVLSREWCESVEAVCWRGKKLLYVSGMHGHVLLVDVETGNILKSVAAVSGPVWCLGLNPNKTRLAAGTEDGFVSLFNVEEEDLLEYIGVLEPKGSRVLSLSWHPSEPLLVTSGRGRVWLWDIDQMNLKMELRPPKRGKEDAIVACVLLLNNGTIVSGDSAGSTIFWDASTGTPLMTFHSHRNGVLALACKDSGEGLKVYASGIDSLITEMRLVPSKNGYSTWVTSSPRYYHTHDVRALCHTGKYLVSGGADAYLCVASDGIRQLVKLPPNTDVSRVSIANSYLTSSTPLLLLQNSRRLEMWQLSQNLQENQSTTGIAAADYFQLLNFTLGKGNETINSSAMSPNGEWLVVSSFRLTKAYRIVLAKDARNKVDLNLVPAQTSNGALAEPVDQFAFCPNGILVVADTAGVYSCTTEWTSASHGRQSALVDRKLEIFSFRKDERIRLLAASKSGRFVAIVTSKNEVAIIDSLHPSDATMEAEDEDFFQRTKWRNLIPTQSTSVVTALALTETSVTFVILAYANGTVASFDTRTLEYTKIPGVWKDIPSAFTHCSVHGKLAVLHNWNEGVILGHDSKHGWTVNKNLQFDEHLIKSVLSPGGELVNIVQTPSMLQNQLPPALAKKVFGV